MFQSGATTRISRLPPFPEQQAPRDSCPWCNKKGDYDHEFLRVVQARRYGTRIGLGPAKSDPGVDMQCICLCVTM